MSAREQFEGLFVEVCASRDWICQSDQVEVKLESGRRQVVHLAYFEHEGRAMVRFHTVIGSTERIRAGRLQYALEINFSLPHGAMAVRSDELVMVDTLILADADPGEIEASRESLAATAAPGTGPVASHVPTHRWEHSAAPNQPRDFRPALAAAIW